MVFSSVPLFLDPPNWNQEGSNNEVVNEVNDGQHLQNPPPPTSMTERAKLAKIPQSEAALKCPRCDSANTKFCYFNNYSLTQPRHFCKTCRRYWTRGGALRSVPVGGGCRRNKRGNKIPSSGSKPSSSSSASAVPAVNPSGPSAGVFRTAPPQFLAPWAHHLPDYGFGGIQPTIDTSAAAESVGLEQWRIQQFPFMGGLAESAAAAAAAAGMVPGMYQFEGNGKIIMPGMKMEESSQSQDLTANLPRQFFNMGRNIDGHEIWPGGGGGGGGDDDGGRWVSSDHQHLSGFSSSSTGNFYKR